MRVYVYFLFWLKKFDASKYSIYIKITTNINFAMNKSYIAGFCDGDGSICIGKCNDGFLLKVEFTQCNKEYLDKINEYFENKGKLYIDKRKKYNHEQAYQLRYCGAKAKPILEIMAEHAVLESFH